jgi:hypothetical protein
MSFSFPNNPTINQQSTQNGRDYTWSGSAWEFSPSLIGTTNISDGAVTLIKTTGVQKTITSGTAVPTGGSSGDIYLRYT